MKKLIYGMLTIAFMVSGCNTMEGLGEDIEAGGQKLENAAEKRKK